MSATDKPAGGAAASQQKREGAENEKAQPPAANNAIVPTFTVTQATHNDIADICSLYKKVWDEFKGKVPSQLEHSWQPTPLEFTSQMEGVTFFAARKERKLVGILGCSEEEGSVRLLHLAVDPDVRHQGVGSALISTSLDWARRSSTNSVWVEALTQFTSGIALFRKAGFKEIGRFHKHLWKEDVMLMELVL